MHSGSPPSPLKHLSSTTTNNTPGFAPSAPSLRGWPGSGQKKVARVEPRLVKAMHPEKSWVRCVRAAHRVACYGGLNRTVATSGRLAIKEKFPLPILLPSFTFVRPRLNRFQTAVRTAISSGSVVWASCVLCIQWTTGSTSTGIPMFARPIQ